ncbi:hypothetical protein JQ604_30730 [Bradyrhizobium jicamae]|uniref:hypothetical protein n=1 Tax=Bradyrhizobium jicamae TaxID=280332 RepID=UPI001BA705FB|nr:hypothetical protein [Bradyrhizobium jicamae]MBR0756576.1 hypothetical protein [Bradyrhizobium jicamae]
MYSRYFDEPGGAFCGVQHEAVQLQNVRICNWTGMSFPVLNLLRTDLRHTGDSSKILIKYTSGIVYQCFWFDDREFDYWIDGMKSPVADGCADHPRNLIMKRKTKND